MPSERIAHVSPRAVARAAYVAAGANLAAAAALALVLQPGLPLPGNDLPARQAYLAEHTAIWWAGWLLWHAAALALLAFYVGLAGYWGQRAPIRCGLALLCAGAGLAVDLGAQTLYIGVLPGLGPEAFAAVEDAAGVLTGYLGNGLYTVAGLLLTWAGLGELPRYVVALGLVVWAAGLGLSAASLGHSASGQFWSTAVLMPTLVLWLVLVGRGLERA
jgi:hypothetical protein